MKLQTKIAVLIGIIILIFTVLIYLIQLIEDKKTKEILIDRKIEKSESFEHSILSVGKTLEVFSTDYTQWDEMVTFVYDRDSVWALENIEYPIESFKANAVWIFDKKFNQVYDVNNLEMKKLEKYFLETNELKILFSKKWFNHFFVQINQQLFEMRAAPIQPTEDVHRIAEPEGYFVVARLWSKNVLDEISSLTSSRVRLENINHKPNNEDNTFIIKVSKILYDWKGNPIIKLASISDFSLLKKSSDVFNLQMILGLTLSLSVLLIVVLFFFIAVNKPLKIIQHSLEQQNPVQLVKTAKQKNEFGKLAQLIIQFFNQKEKLIDEEKQRRFVESSLSQSEAKYKKIFDNIQDIFYQADLNGKITSISPSIERYSEYTPEEVIGKDITNFYLDPKTREKLLEQLKTHKEVVDFEISLVTKTGKNISCSVNSHFLYDDNKQIIGIEGSLRGISERKKNEEQIIKLSRVVEQSPVSIIVTDIEGNVEYVNSKFEQVSGYSFNEVKNKNITSVIREIISDEVFNNLWKTLPEGNEWSGELPSKTKSGELGWENVFIIPIKNQSNKITNYVALKEDITEKKKIIEELKSAKEKAEEMNNLKSSFLANMSHELRTPMMGILGNAEIITISTEDEDIKDMATAIFQSGKRLINTLNLILDLTRIEANKDSVDIDKLEVTEIIKDVVEHFAPAAKQKDLTLSFTSDLNEVYSNLDERLFRETLNNLINNAIKFTNTGRIIVTLAVENQKIIIKVIDTGIGIPPHSLGLIFEEFRQVSEGYGRNFEGTGLGLTITKKFVEKLNGKISVKSELNKGSEFTIEFPVDKV